MPASPSRRTNLLDGMIALAGVAAGCLLTRHYFYVVAVRQANLTGPGSPFWLDVAVVECLKVGTLWLGVFSPLTLLMRLRQPRPDLVGLLRQPGVVATGAATLVVGAAFVGWWMIAAIEGLGFGSFLFRASFAATLTSAGAAVAATWALLALARQWSPEPSGVDRGGRFLGACWIVAWLAATATGLHQSAALTAGGSRAVEFFSGSSLIDHKMD